MERKPEIAVGGIHLLFLFRSIDPHISIYNLVRLILLATYSATALKTYKHTFGPNQ